MITTVKKKVEKLVVEEVTVYQLELTAEELSAIHIMAASVSGLGKIRQHTDKLYREISKVLGNLEPTGTDLDSDRLVVKYAKRF